MTTETPRARGSLLLLLVASLLTLSACGDDGTETQTNPANNGGNNTVSEDRDPGRVTIQRLNRAEYNNTVRDLLGTSMRPADDFPADDFGYGFDNNGDVLSLSPLLLELYHRSAETLVEEALNVPINEPNLDRFEAELLEGSVGAVFRGEGWNLWSNGTLGPTVELPQDGEYRLAVRAWGQQAGDEPAKMNLNVNGVVAGMYDVEATENAPGIYEVTLELEGGITSVEVEFINDFYDPDNGGDRNLIVDWIEVEGPLGVEGERNPIRDRVVTCDPAADGEEACAREVIGGFAAKAWRRPLQDGELDELMALYGVAIEEGDGFDVGLSVALQAILVSPHFIFRVELDPLPTDLDPHLVGNFEMASRLSYFLWSSMPDAELYELAASGSLNDEAVLAAQIDRMIADPKADALIENFAGPWLYIRALDDVQPDYQYYPDYDEELRDAMQKETQLFFAEFLRQDLPLDEMFSAEFTFVNNRLATHYGLPSVGEGFHRVETGGERRGLLTQGSILTVTSYPTRTSPVKRGKWILTQLMCSEPPPPPPGVEGLLTEAMPSGTLRERLEAHRADPQCAVCHNLMDPVGFALENYDGVGLYRTDDRGGFPIDASGKLPTGEVINNVHELGDVIAASDEFAECVVEQLFVYALGRGTKDADTPYLEELTGDFVGGDYRLSHLITSIVLSEPFRFRRGESEIDASDMGGE